MKISLRKANAVQGAITEALAALNLNTEVVLTEFENVDEVLAREIERFTESTKARTDLQAALFDIRTLVGIANVSEGVSTKLARLAALEKDINCQIRLAKSTPMLSRSVLGGKLDKIRNRKEDSGSMYYGDRSDTVSTSILTEEAIAAFAAKARELKKAKVALQDKLLELNVRAEIKLGHDTVETLKAHGII